LLENIFASYGRREFVKVFSNQNSIAFTLMRFCASVESAREIVVISLLTVMRHLVGESQSFVRRIEAYS